MLTCLPTDAMSHRSSSACGHYVNTAISAMTREPTHSLTVTGVDAWLRPPEVLRMRGAGSREHPQAITPTSPSAGILKGLKRKSRPLLERL